MASMLHDCMGQSSPANLKPEALLFGDTNIDCEDNTIILDVLDYIFFLLFFLQFFLIFFVMMVVVVAHFRELY